MNIDWIYIYTATHRLDRITSGLNLIAKNAKRADIIEKEMRAGDIKKEYVCRVSGEFPL
jgi:23S rRNA-/tRNA-specific pseudouridylate synthase